ncbi:unnamed protein product [Symbiodinium microadriaticum]|nr:unnamed protein product [Symbiodinium microadriaticum]
MPPKAAKRKFQYAKGSVDGLAKNWADRAIVREKLLKSKTLLSWPERRLVGVISCRALKLNKQVMLAMADILGPQSDIPLGVVVQPMKAQVRKIRNDLSMPDDIASTHCEARAIKRFQSLINKKLFVARKKRDPELEDLYAVYRSHWRKPTREEMGLPPLPNAEEEDMIAEDMDNEDEELDEGAPALQDEYFDDDDEDDDDDDELGCKLGALQMPAEGSKEGTCSLKPLADEPKLADCAAPEAPPKPARSLLQSLATPMNKTWTTTAELKVDRVERLARIAWLKKAIASKKVAPPAAPPSEPAGPVNPVEAETQIELGPESEPAEALASDPEDKPKAAAEALPSDPEDKPKAADSKLSDGHAKTDDANSADGKVAEQAPLEDRPHEKDSAGRPPEDVFDAPDEANFGRVKQTQLAEELAEDDFYAFFTTWYKDTEKSYEDAATFKNRALEIVGEFLDEMGTESAMSNPRGMSTQWIYGGPPSPEQARGYSSVAVDLLYDTTAPPPKTKRQYTPAFAAAVVREIPSLRKTKPTLVCVGRLRGFGGNVDLGNIHGMADADVDAMEQELRQLEDGQRCPQNTKEWSEHVEARQRAGLDTKCYSSQKAVPSTPSTWELPETLPDGVVPSLAATLFSPPAVDASTAPPKPSVAPSRKPSKPPSPGVAPPPARITNSDAPEKPSAPVLLPDAKAPEAPVLSAGAKAPQKPSALVPDAVAPEKPSAPVPEPHAKATETPVPNTHAKAPARAGKGTGNANPVLAVPVTMVKAGEDAEYASAPEPSAEPADLSDGAIRKRVYRLVAPREDGSYRLPDSVIQEYKDPLTRHKVVREFEKCGWQPDAFVRKCRKLVQSEEEVEIKEEWEFLTEEEMREANWTTLYDKKTMYWCCIKVKGHKRNIKRSLMDKLQECDDDTIDIKDGDLEMDFAQLDMEGADGGAPAAESGPTLEGIDKKMLQCFPDLEKVAQPSTVVGKAGIAIGKRAGKLDMLLTDLDECVETKNIGKMRDRCTSAQTELMEIDQKLGELIEAGLVDGYSGELQTQIRDELVKGRSKCVQSLMLEPRARAMISSAKKKRDLSPAAGDSPVERLVPCYSSGQKTLATELVPRESLEFPVDDGSKPIVLPWIRPSSWFGYLVPRYPRCVFGTAQNWQQELLTFWECYQRVHGGHEVFRHPSRLSRTIPLALHGDEGRYLKRSNFLVLTVESVLGVQRPRRQPCDCKSDPCLERYGDLHGLEGAAQRKASKQECNAKGHPYLSKFLCCGMSSSQYKEHPELLDSILELLSADLRKFCIEGIDIPGHGRLYGGFLGLKGDMAFHHKVGQLSRSYYNLGKRSDIPICHLCLAGAPNVAFETVSDTPDWEGSYCMSEPWESPPALASVPFDPLRKAEIFRLDPFHLWRVGLGRDLVGSGIVCLCQLGYMDLEPGCSKNIDDRLVRAHALFKLWCAGTGRTPALRSFSVHNFNCKSRSKYPWANVKGSDCTLMTDWLLFFTRNQIGDVKPEHQSFISALQQTLASAVAFWSILHSHGLWLDRYCAQCRIRFSGIPLRCTACWHWQTEKDADVIPALKLVVVS